MTTRLEDMEEEGESNCCGAKVYLGICSDCGEHCDVVEYGCDRCEDKGYFLKTEWVWDDEHGDMDYEIMIRCDCQDD